MNKKILKITAFVAVMFTTTESKSLTGYCMTDDGGGSQALCQTNEDCSWNEKCIISGGGGGGSCGTAGCYCVTSSTCYEGYYCKPNTSGSSGTCQPIPDCSQGCTNCDTTSWVAYRTGYQSRTDATCDCTTCMETIVYRCAAGYYGTSTNGTSGCTRCPSSGGVYGTSVAGSTSITSCYLPSGTTGSDSTGSFTYTGNCYYNN